MKYFLGFLASVGLIVFVFILIVRGFNGNSKKVTTTPLTDYANSSVEMQYTIDGPVNADQDHKSVRITVGQNEVVIETLKGYDQTVGQTQTFDNNQTSYSTFLRALDIAGYSKGNTDSSKKDERGYCPTGTRYSYDIIDGSDTKQHFWSASCSSPGTFKGNMSQVRVLFQAQIPNYDTSLYSVTQ
jgi:hypothetical protein